MQPGVLLADPAVRRALREAWEDSQPGQTGGHEEGGFITMDAAGVLSVSRWPRGAQDVIRVPPHPGCRIQSIDIVGSFHTHPNTGTGYLQQPSDTDRRAVRDDPNLKGPNYIGEFVISERIIYLISPSGIVTEMGATPDLLG
jgi:hypothetical protein